MEVYSPDSFCNHVVKITLQAQGYKAEVIAEMSGNVHGGSVLESFTSFETGITVPMSHENTAKYCGFNEEVDKKFGEPDFFKLYDPEGNELIIDAYDADDHIVAIEIISYEQED